MKYLICLAIMAATGCVVSPAGNARPVELQTENAPPEANPLPETKSLPETMATPDGSLPMDAAVTAESAAPAIPVTTLGPVKPATALGPAIAHGDEQKSDPLVQASFAEAMLDVEKRQRVFGEEPGGVLLEGSFMQGGLLFGKTASGARVRLDGENVMVDGDGRFVIGFGRDSALSALLTVATPDGEVERRSIDIADREFPVDRIDGLDQSKVSGFTDEQLEQISRDRAKKKAARQTTQENADWAAGFDWPLTGRISGVFGSQRILNGEPKRPHSGVDVAQPAGTPVRAPAPGIIRLAEGDMYFEGGLVLLDHGQWLESAFLHMSRLDVEPGQRVEKGEIIGAVGATGRVTGPHLHWSVKWVGRLVDPQLLVGEMPAPAENAGN